MKSPGAWTRVLRVYCLLAAWGTSDMPILHGLVASLSHAPMLGFEAGLGVQIVCLQALNPWLEEYESLSNASLSQSMFQPVRQSIS